MADLQQTAINDTGFLQLPVGTTGERLASPNVGYLRYNTTESYLEAWDGSEWIEFGSGDAALFNFTNATFTPGGSTGRTGPSLSQARNGLSGPETNEWKNNTQFFNTSNGIQLWTVPQDGTYRIEAFGAEGGGGGAGGLGARMRGDFQLTEGEIIRILVGQQGEDNGVHGGGGGGSFVVRTPYNTNQSILVIAGGGGSISERYNNSQSDPNSVGQAGTSGGSGFQVGAGGLGTPGSNGQGGTGNSSAYGGGGFFSGGDGGAQSFTSGGAGESRTADGGFGGGGGAATGWDRNGGGGGYSGGSGARGSSGSRGGGGGSFNSGTNQSNTAGVRSGSGQVQITLL